MSMSKKDYEAIARAIKDARPFPSPRHEIAIANDIINNVANNLAEECERANPRFDRARFLRACGVQS